MRADEKIRSVVIRRVILNVASDTMMSVMRLFILSLYTIDNG